MKEGRDSEGFNCLFIDTYKGCGTFTTIGFDKEDFLLEYKGELVDQVEGEWRLKSHPQSKVHSCISLYAAVVITVKWSPEESKEVEDFFSDDVKRLKAPGKNHYVNHT